MRQSTGDFIIDLFNTPAIVIGKKEPNKTIILHQHNYYLINKDGEQKLLRRTHEVKQLTHEEMKLLEDHA